MKNIDAETLRSLIHYDPATGIFTWLPGTEWHSRRFAGKQAGSLESLGYITLSVLGFRTKAHRWAWLYMTGEWPSREIDHIDRDKANNAWTNLRLATGSENKANTGMRVTNTSGYKGVRMRKGKWHASISVRNKRLELGGFADIKEAAAAYAAAAKEHFGDFANLGATQ